jgi:hypothetical protein
VTPEVRHRVLSALDVLDDRARDDEFLHRYWTTDPEGLAKWATSPRPWTALVRHLTKHVGRARAERMAAKWHHEVFGYWPGQRERKKKKKVGAGRGPG